jgi:hypothetical protein
VLLCASTFASQCSYRCFVLVYICFGCKQKRAFISIVGTNFLQQQKAPCSLLCFRFSIILLLCGLSCEGKPMILNVKGPRQESVLKQKGVLWSLCLIVRN